MVIRHSIIAFIFSLTVSSTYAQSTLQYASFKTVHEGIKNNKDQLVILNFWATWCKPCVAELPDFEQINAEFKDKGVQVILANLDFHSKTDSIIPPFIVKRNLQSTVLHITDKDPNDWINLVDVTWSGTIPATAIYFKGEKVWFVEGQTDYETLKSIVTKYIH
jgi:thiol-disulfide isomerase/thioredoxin